MDDLLVIENIEILKKHKIIIYGAGTYGGIIKRTLNYIGLEIMGFCDSNPAIWGQNYNDFKIFSLEELKDICANEDIFLIIAIYNYNAVESVLQLITKFNICPVKICTCWAIIKSVQLNEKKVVHYDDIKSDLRGLKQKQDLLEGLCRQLDLVSRIAVPVLNGKNPILVYSPGKVASTTVHNSLSICGLENIHTHWLFFDAIKEYSVPEWIKSEKDTIKIISLVREPVSRDISLFFQLLDTFRVPFDIDIGNIDNHLEKSFYHQLDRYVLKKENYQYKNTLFRLMDEARGRMLDEFEWFTDELYRATGIDVYAYPFDTEKGYTIIKKNNIEILILQVEKLNSLENIISEFVGCRTFYLSNTNEAHSKLYYYAYKDFMRKISIRDKYYEHYYKDNKKFEHFYSSAQIDEFRLKWKNRII